MWTNSPSLHEQPSLTPAEEADRHFAEAQACIKTARLTRLKLRRKRLLDLAVEALMRAHRAVELVRIDNEMTKPLPAVSDKGSTTPKGAAT